MPWATVRGDAICVGPKAALYVLARLEHRGRRPATALDYFDGYRFLQRVIG